MQRLNWTCGVTRYQRTAGTSFLASSLRPHDQHFYSSTMSPSKLHGRAFYESIGSPKHILAPMVDASEFAWRMLTRSFLPESERQTVLTYSPMLHAKMFGEKVKYRNEHFRPLKAPFLTQEPGTTGEQSASPTKDEPFLDGNPKFDRPLFMQFCANDPEAFLEAAKQVAPFCDAVDLNLGCPQGIAKRGSYGAFLQEDWDTIYKLINTLHTQLDIPVTAKMRILETRERTLEYAKMILSAGASILTVHGRLREQKGHNTGLADWSMIKYLRENLPPETVLFANGNILQHDDIDACLKETGVDGVMSAEGNLYDPSIFATAPTEGTFEREYWRGREGLGGWRCDAVVRRYYDIIYKHVLCRNPPERAPLWLPTDPLFVAPPPDTTSEESSPPPKKKQKREDIKANPSKHVRPADINLNAMQGHMFHILRAMVKEQIGVRDHLARTRSGDMESFEQVLTLVEAAVREGLTAYEKDPTQFDLPEVDQADTSEPQSTSQPSTRSVIRRCRRPWFVCQPNIRPLPHEAYAKGSLQLKKKEIAKLKQAEEEHNKLAKAVNVAPNGTTGVESLKNSADTAQKAETASDLSKDNVEVPREGLVCG